MISYHPDSRFLTDFASANLSLSEAICVSAHLEFCGKCRGHVQQLADLGGRLLSRINPGTLQEGSFDSLMKRVDIGGDTEELAKSSEAVESAPESSSVGLPRALHRLVTKGLQHLQWVQMGKAMRIAPLRIDGDPRETSLYDIKAGGQMIEHEHRGEEITVLLKGSFSDAEGSYSRGDFVVRNAGEPHQPTATQDMDCLCLVSLQRPVKPGGWFYRLVEPYVQYRLRRVS